MGGLRVPSVCWRGWGWLDEVIRGSGQARHERSKCWKASTDLQLRSLQMIARRWAALLAALGAFERILIWLLYAPTAYGDTASYQRLAAALDQGGLSAYDATRVPGYPLVLLLVDGDPNTVQAGQMAIGWATSMLLFWLGWRATGSAIFGFVLGMLYNVLAGQVLVESALLSESLATFFVIASIAGLVTLAQARRYVGALALALGFIAAGAGLVRALFYPLAVWLAAFLVLPNTVDAVPARFARVPESVDCLRDQPKSG